MAYIPSYDDAQIRRQSSFSYENRNSTQDSPCHISISRTASLDTELSVFEAERYFRGEMDDDAAADDGDENKLLVNPFTYASRKGEELGRETKQPRVVAHHPNYSATPRSCCLRKHSQLLVSEPVRCYKCSRTACNDHGHVPLITKPKKVCGLGFLNAFMCFLKGNRVIGSQHAATLCHRTSTKDINGQAIQRRPKHAAAPCGRELPILQAAAFRDHVRASHINGEEKSVESGCGSAEYGPALMAFIGSAIMARRSIEVYGYHRTAGKDQQMNLQNRPAIASLETDHRQAAMITWDSIPQESAERSTDNQGTCRVLEGADSDDSSDLFEIENIHVNGIIGLQQRSSSIEQSSPISSSCSLNPASSHKYDEESIESNECGVVREACTEAVSPDGDKETCHGDKETCHSDITTVLQSDILLS